MATYWPTDKEYAEIEEIFTFHPVRDDDWPSQADRYQDLRNQAKQLARSIVKLCPPSRERSLAITSLQQTVMWANAAIAIHEREDA